MPFSVSGGPAESVVDVRIQQTFDVPGAAHRIREGRAGALDEAQLGSHGLEGQQNVGEQDRRVDAKDLRRVR